MCLSGTVTPRLPMDGADLGIPSLQEQRPRPWREAGFKISRALCADLGFSARGRKRVPPSGFPKLDEAPETARMEAAD